MSKHAYRAIIHARCATLMAVVANPFRTLLRQRKLADAVSGRMLLVRTGVMMTLLCGDVTMLSAQIVADRNAASRPVVDQTASGLPLVQIVAPNAAGVSHNRYAQFSVGQSGAILNNATSTTQTQLGGYVAANAALTNNGARLILNEVTGSARSQLNGYLEVAGQRAEVVVANPNGISCNGCGFINTSRGVLTTGTPELAADGSLASLRVTGGDISIDGSGMNASSLDQIDLIARSVQVNGALWGNQLNLVTGANLVNYANLGVQVIQGQGTQATVSIDVAQMGGMYANRIRLIGSEAGVGVRSLGDIAAQAGDVSIDSKGLVTLNGSTTASGNLAIQGSTGIVNSGTVYSQQSLSLNSQGQIGNSGTMAAQGDLNLNSASISSSGTLGAGIDSSGSATQAASLSLTASGTISATGQNTAGGNLSMNGASLSLAAAHTSAAGTTTLTASAGDIDHRGASVQSAGGLTFSATGTIDNTQGTINTSQLSLHATALSNQQGQLIQYGSNATTIAVSGTLDNSNGGLLQTNSADLRLTPQTLLNDGGTIAHAGSGSLTLDTGSGTLSNQGGSIGTNGQLTLNAGRLNNQAGTMTATAQAAIRLSGDLGNAQGTIQSGSGLTLTAVNIDNSAGSITSLDNTGMQLTASGRLTNSGTIGANGDVTITAATLLNSGSITASKNLTGTVASSVDNSSGRLAAGQNIGLNAASLINVNGSIDADTMALAVLQLDNSSGTITANQLAITSDNLTNQQGQLIQYGSAVTDITVAGTFDNSHGGLLRTNGSDLNVSAQAIDTAAGTIAHAGSGIMTLASGTGVFSNQGGAVASNGQLALTAASLNNQAGSITAVGQATIDVAGNISNAQGTLQFGRALTLAGTNIDNSAGSIKSLNSDGMQLTASGTLTNAGTGVIGGNGDVTISAAHLINSGTITASNQLIGTMSDSIDNDDGRLAAGQKVSLDAASLSNANGSIDAALVALSIAQLDNSSGKITADQLTITSDNLNNQQGQLIQYGSNATTIAVSGTLDNSNGGLLQTSSADLSLTPRTLINDGGTIAHAGSGQLTLTIDSGAGSLSNVGGSIGTNGQVAVRAASVDNRGGSLFASRQLSVTVSQGDLDNSGAGYLSGSGLDLQVANGDINNGSGTIEGTQQAVTLQANSLNNAGGSLQSIGAAALTISTTNSIVNTVANGVGGVGGFIGSAGVVSLTAGSVDNSGGTVYAQDTLTLQSNGALTNRAGVIQSAASINASATGTLDNSGGRIEANGASATLDVSAASINNSAGRIANSGTGMTRVGSGSQIANVQGTIGGNGDVSIQTVSLNNSGQGKVLATGNLALTIDSLLNNDTGSLYAGQTLTADAAHAAISNNGGDISGNNGIALSGASIANIGGTIGSGTNASGDIVLTTSASLNNTSGTVASGRSLRITAAGLLGSGSIAAVQDVTIQLQGDYVNTAGSVLLANHDLTLTTSGKLSNAGSLLAVNALTLNAANLDNQASGLVNASAVTIKAGNAITNTGRIYGDDIALAALSLTNDVDSVSAQAGAIAARNSINIGAVTVVNREHALIQSMGNMNFGRTLDASLLATGVADSITNSSATIDAGGAMSFRTAQLNNLNAHFTSATQVDDTQTVHVTEYAQWDKPDIWYTADQVTWSDSGGGGIVVVLPNGDRFEKFYKRDYTQTVSNTVVTSSDPGKISSGGNMLLSGTVTNDKSVMIAGGTISGSTGNINNIGATGQTDTVNHMTAGENYYHWVSGHPHQNYYTYDNSGQAYDVVLPSTSLDLAVWSVTQNTSTASAANPATGQAVAGATLPAMISNSLTGNQASQGVLANNALSVALVSASNGSDTTTSGSSNGVTSASGTAGSSTGTSGHNQTVGSATNALPNLRLPSNRLYSLHTEPGTAYLIESDPAFTSYRSFVSSDYMLSRLAVDPQTIQKRLGDGFYEQGQVTEQVMQLTGRRTLTGYASAETQYQALMDAGVASAKQFNLVPGVALSAAQMAALTADIVWLVDQVVTLPDGSQTTVLAPVVYLARANASDLKPSGALIAGQDIDLSINGSLSNGGTLQAASSMIIQATDIQNTGSIKSTADTGSVALLASNDVTSNGSISGNRVGILAGRDVTLASTTVSAMSVDGLNTKVDRVSSIDAGQLAIQAGRDVSLVAAKVTTTGDASVVAGGDLNLSTVKTQDSYNITYDSRNHLSQSATQVLGSSIEAGGALTLIATQDINAQAAYANAAGALTVAAGGNVNLGAAQQETSLDQSIYTTSKGWFNSSTSAYTDKAQTVTSVGSTLSGDSVQVQAGKNLTITGSNVVGTKDVALSATDITITTAQNTGTRETSSRETTSGLMSSGFGVTLGSRGQDRDTSTSSVSNIGSSVGSVGGNVTIAAANHYTQTGSDVMAPGGDITISAKTVDINAAYDTSSLSDRQAMRQSGLTLALTSPVITALQTVQQMSVASKQTKDPRMLAMAAAAAASSLKDGYNAVSNMASDTQNMSGVKITLSIGASKSDSTMVQTAEQAKGSNVGAGGNVTIVASGAGEQSNITAIGSNIRAVNNVNLLADNQINLLSAQSTSSQTSNNNSSGASLGIGFAMGGSQNGFTLEAGVNMGRGNADGSDLVNVNTSVKAGNTAALISGGDTNIKGATVAGDTVLAYVGGDLNVASLQDTSKYDSKQNSAGLSVSLCIPPFCYGSSSASGSMSNAKVNGDFASVTEQSGIKAGDGGFQIAVSGNTDLKGAVIESTQKAIDNGRNSLLTGSLTVSSIENHDSYDATGFSVSGSVSGKAGDQSTAKKDSPDASAANSKSNPGGNAGISSESGSQSSTTVSGISGAAVTITNAAAQQALTGQTAAEVIAGLNRDVNTDKDTSGALSKSWDGNQLMQQTQAQVQITAAFGAAASKAIGDYAQAQLEEAKALREEAKKELDPAKSEAMLASAQSIDDSWGESGTSRVLAHALVGGITGGLEGAVGAAASAAVASSINHLLDSSDLPDPVKQAVGAALATATGAVVGGGAGAATAFNEDVNNRQLHANERQWAKDNKAKYRQYLKDVTGEDITDEEAYRRLLSAGFAITDKAAEIAGKSDEIAKKFIATYKTTGLFVASAEERNNPFLSGNADGSWSPEQQARYGASNPTAWSDALVKNASLYVGKSCSDAYACDAKVNGIVNAVTALEQKKILYQDDPVQLAQITAQQQNLLNGMSKSDVQRAKLAQADMSTLLDILTIASLPSAVADLSVSLVKLAGTQTSKAVGANRVMPKTLPENLEGFANPNDIKFTQNSVANTFKDGTTLQSTIDDLKSGKLLPSDLPPIRVFEKDGVVYTLDNRRLLAASEAGVPIKVVPATAEEITKEGWKMTTTNGGSIICVRGICK